VVWTEAEMPPDFRKQFCFEKITTNLNYLNDDLKAALPLSDSRLRMDIRLWEEGKEK
jgi:hypothetical protein